ncbi:MAG: GntR family transcriptional regulator [Thermoanaerobaculales bacterium]|jgi:DNA-binding GntR family transcriptional regulator|nr:GntR family transcriptional regulator [Thermoanaerobaculales bacterium]
MAGPRTIVAAPRRTAAEEVYRSLRRDIVTLQHRPGAPLGEQALADTYGTSRVPVREACRRLQQEGLLTSIPYKGYFVSPISPKEISDSFELRSAIETRAVSLAVGRASDRELERLSSLASIEYTYSDWASYADFLDKNLGFHLEVASLSRNDRLFTVLHNLLVSMQRFFFLGLDLGDFGAEMRNEHELLVRHMIRRDDVAAAACAEQQITASYERIRRALAAAEGVELPISEG